MSDSRGSSRGSGSGKRRAPGVRRAGGPSQPQGGSAKGSSRTGDSKGSSRTGRAAGAASGTSGARASGGAKASTGAKAAGGAKASTGAKPSSAGKKPGGKKTAAAASAAAAGTHRNWLARTLNYPRAGKKRGLRWLPSFRLLAGAFALVVLLGLGGVVWMYETTKVPEPAQFAVAQTTQVYYSDGKTKMGQFSEIDRTILPSKEIPDNVKDAVVASEDSSFYENRGVSPRGILRALVNNLRGGAQQGGSTITQQYVERYYTGTTTSYTGKVKEMFMAIKIDQELSKDEILSRYLNTIYFGRGAYGVQAASQAYFGKDAEDMTDEEAALLVAMIPAPSSYDPAVNEKTATQKWDRVITRQVNETGYLTESQAEDAKFPETTENKQKNYMTGTNGYLLSYIRKELEAEGLSEDDLNTGGYKIVSTIDPKVQKITTDTIKDLPEDRPENNRVGTVTIDPDSGAIRALYGGKDFVKQSLNDAVDSRMQAGSIFKTFTLIGALQDGYGLYSQWDGNSPHSFPGWTVKNFGNTSYGTVSLKEATAHSINTAYAALNLQMGPAKTKKAAIQLGLPKKTPGLDDGGSNVLGTASPTVLEMGEAYATIANQGTHHDSYMVQTVEESDGATRYKHKDKGKQVLDEAVAINATVALQGPPTTGSARSLQQVMGGRQVAGKTGTSEKFRSAWFVGFTPQLVTSVGMFQPAEDGSTEESLTPFGGETQMTGGKWPTTIWGQIMSQALEGQDFETFPEAVQIPDEKGGTETQPPTTTQAPEPTETEEPTEEPSEEPSETEEPTEEPSESETPTEEPSESEEPTEEPTETETPSDEPSETDSDEPSEAPTESEKPTEKPTETKEPTEKPSKKPKPTGGAEGQNSDPDQDE